MDRAFTSTANCHSRPFQRARSKASALPLSTSRISPNSTGGSDRFPVRIATKTSTSFIFLYYGNFQIWKTILFEKFKSPKCNDFPQPGKRA